MPEKETSFVTYLKGLTAKAKDEVERERKVLREYDEIVSGCEEAAKKRNSHFLYGHTCYSEKGTHPLDPLLIEMVKRKFGENCEEKYSYPKEYIENEEDYSFEDYPCEDCGIRCWNGIVITW